MTISDVFVSKVTNEDGTKILHVSMRWAFHDEGDCNNAIKLLEDMCKKVKCKMVF
jgi:hypothetical protein